MGNGLANDWLVLLPRFLPYRWAKFWAKPFKFGSSLDSFF